MKAGSRATPMYHMRPPDIVSLLAWGATAPTFPPFVACRRICVLSGPRPARQAQCSPVIDCLVVVLLFARVSPSLALRADLQDVPGWCALTFSIRNAAGFAWQVTNDLPACPPAWPQYMAYLLLRPKPLHASPHTNGEMIRPYFSWDQKGRLVRGRGFSSGSAKLRASKDR